MAVSFVPTVEDALAFIRYLAANSPQVQATLRQNRRTAYVLTGSIAIPLIAAMMLTHTSLGPWIKPYLHYGMRMVCIMCVLVLGAFLWTYRGNIGQRGIVRRSLERQARSGDLELDLRPTTVTIGPDGVCVDRGNAGAWHQWSAMQRIVESDQHFLLFWTRDQAMVVPIAAFASPERAAEFQRLVESNLRRDADRSSAPPTIPAKR
jgi:hypothetical protein